MYNFNNNLIICSKSNVFDRRSNAMSLACFSGKKNEESETKTWIVLRDLMERGEFGWVQELRLRVFFLSKSTSYKTDLSKTSGSCARIRTILP